MGNARSNADTGRERLMSVSVDIDLVRKDILKIMDTPDWDDGSYAPILIRLAWHASGTYDAEDGSGGPDGATMRFELEANDPDNAGLHEARALLEPIKSEYPGLSYADLWVLASYCAIEHTGGPSIVFCGGRIDASADKAIAPGRLPNPEKGTLPGLSVDEEGRVRGWEGSAAHIREVFGRMGFSDREMVALICGGHVYGRCHVSSSGYAGAWVENPTFFSNEYAVDMFEDQWILVGHDSKLPDGRPVPDEIRPALGKRQYINLSKLVPDDNGRQENKINHGPINFPPGAYACMSDWVNIREQADVSSPIIGRFTKNMIVNLVVVKSFGTAVRGLAERGGWVSVIGSGGKVLFERTGDLDFKYLIGTYRRLAAVPTFSSLRAKGDSHGSITSSNFRILEASLGMEGNSKLALFGKLDSGAWALLYSPKHGLLAEKIVDGYNEKIRKPIKGQHGYQMMLISDMVMMWDSDFRKILEEYAQDEKILKHDFGRAFKRLTELGCPWSKDRLVTSKKHGGCAFACSP